MFLLEDSRIDTRALAVLRMGLGVLLIVDTLLRLRNFTYFYTDNGPVPYDVVAPVIYNYPTAAFPIWEFTTHPALTAALFIASLVAGVLLIAGYKTRVVTVIAFLLVCAIDARNPFVLSYADLLFHLLLLWAIFLPLGERWSIDANLRIRSPNESVTSIWAMLILFQMVNMYLSNAYFKLQPDYSWSGDVLPVLLTLDHITFEHVTLFNTYTLPLEIASFAWLVLMLISPLLFFLRGYPRALLTAALFGAHLSMAITLRIGAFPYASMLGVILFIQPGVWNDAAAFLHRAQPARRAHNIITNTGVRTARVIERVEPAPHRQYAARKKTKQALGVLFCIAVIALIGITIAGSAGVVNTEHGGVDSVNDAMHVFGLHQPPWSFYAADPPYTDKYYVVAGETTDGELVDAYNDRALTFDRPYSESSLHEQYENSYRERFYMNQIADPESDVSSMLQSEYAAHMCESWDDSNDSELVGVSLYQVEESVDADTRFDRDSRPVTVNHLSDHSCSDSTVEQIGASEKP